MEDDEIMAILRSSITTLGMIDTESLEQYVAVHKESLSRWDTSAAFLDPTAYRESLQSGKHKDATYQLEITEALLLVRKAIDKREDFVSSLPEHKE